MIPPAYKNVHARYYGIKDLLSDIRLDDILDTPVGRLDLVDANLDPTAETSGMMPLCSMVTKSDPCVACAVRMRLESEKVVQSQCDAGVLATIARLALDGQTLGYLVHKYPLKQFFERELTCGSPAILAGLERLRDEMQPNPASVLEAVTSAAKRLEKRLSVERRRAIYTEATNGICSAASPPDILHTLFRGLEDFLGEVNICFYALATDGAIKLVDAEGAEQAFLPRTIPFAHGHVGQVIKENKALYAAEVETEPKGFEFGDGPDHPKSVFTTPMRWFAEGFPGALQVSSHRANAYSRTVRESVANLCTLAGAEATKLFQIEKRVLAGPKLQPSSSWWGALVELALERANTTVDVLEARKKLYNAVCEEARRISKARYVSIRIEDPKTRGLRFASCRGDGWTKSEQRTIFAPTDKGAGNTAFHVGKPIYLADVPPQERIHADTRSVYAVPYEVDGSVLGVLTLAWEFPDAASEELRRDVNNLVYGFSQVLAVLAERENALFRQLEETFKLGLGDLKDFAGVLCAGLKKTFQARACSLFLYEPDEDCLRLLATTSPRSDPDREVVYRMGEGLTGWVALNRQPLRITDTPDEQELKTISDSLSNRQVWVENIVYPVDEGKHGYLAAPLLARNKLIGVVRLVVKNDEAEEFSYEEEGLLFESASRIAQSIDVLRQHEVAEKAVSAGDLQGTVQALVDEISRSAEAEGSLLVVEDVKIGLRVKAACGELQLMLAKGCPSPLGGAEAFIVNVGRDKSLYTFTTWMRKDWRDPAAINSAVRIPLPLDPESGFTGYLFAGWKRTEMFLEERKFYLRALVRRLSLALQPVLLQNRTAIHLQQRLDEIHSIKDIGLAFAVTHDYNQLLQSILDTVIKQSGMERGTIRLWDEANKSWRLEAPLGLPEESVPRDVGDHSWFRQTEKEKKPVFIENVQNDLLYQDLRKQATDPARLAYMDRIQSALQIPLRVYDNTFGLILLEGGLHHEFTPEVLDHLEILSQFITVSVLFAQDQKLNRPLALLGGLLNGFLHVMRNRLNDIYASMSLLRRLAKPHPSIMEEINEVDKYLGRIGKVCEDLNQAAASESVNLTETIDVNSVIHNVLSDIDFSAKSIACATNLAVGLPTVLGSVRLLENAFRLIVYNAIEAMQESGTLTITTQRQEDGSIFVRFQDTGPGMDVETRARCWDFFWTTKEKSGGTGMGLPVVRGVITRHGGEVEIDPELTTGCAVNVKLRPKREDKPRGT